MQSNMLLVSEQDADRFEHGMKVMPILEFSTKLNAHILIENA